MTSRDNVVPLRVRSLNEESINRGGKYVIYWMIANRRVEWNFALQRAVEHASRLGKPLLILEALRSGYQWANDRIHRFVLQGMADNRAAIAGTPAHYFAYVEPKHGAGSGLLQRLAEQACVIVTDEFPCFFVPRMLKSTAKRLPILLEAVDSNGLFPIHAVDRVYTTAHSFRRFLQKELPAYMLDLPEPDPLATVKIPEFGQLPSTLLQQWPEAPDTVLSAGSETLAVLPIDHSVGPALFGGGRREALATLDRFLVDRLERYADKRNQPEDDVGSALSPYLHFGHVSSHEVFARIIQRENWSPNDLSTTSNGARTGWWGMSTQAESFLDQLITWRELGYNMCSKTNNYDRYESLPEWARMTIEEHASDTRPEVYSLEQLDRAETHDELWNAAQNQLVTEGRMHNYLRMLWGKKIYQWSDSPRNALTILIELNNRYAVDGRNPNSYSGIFWCLGRYDRAWGPERPIFGKLRYMTSENTARKLNVKQYIQRYNCRNDR